MQALKVLGEKQQSLILLSRGKENTVSLCGTCTHNHRHHTARPNTQGSTPVDFVFLLIHTFISTHLGDLFTPRLYILSCGINRRGGYGQTVGGQSQNQTRTLLLRPQASSVPTLTPFTGGGNKIGVIEANNGQRSLFAPPFPPS